MKKALTYMIILIVSLPLFYSCGPFRSSLMGSAVPEDLRRYEKIISVPGLSRAEIYVKVNCWFVETFNYTESVIEFQDKEAGKIIGKYVSRYHEGVHYYTVIQTISIDIRDEKMRIVIHDPNFEIMSNVFRSIRDEYPPLKTQQGIDNVRARWEELSTELGKYLHTEDIW
jgi:hypothetical protein